jgi:hypothetical protein
VRGGPGLLSEAISLVRALGDQWALCQILTFQAVAAVAEGNPIAVRSAGQEGLDLAEVIGDFDNARQCRWCLAMAEGEEGDAVEAAAQFGELGAEAHAAHDRFPEANSGALHGHQRRIRAELDIGHASHHWHPEPSNRLFADEGVEVVGGSLPGWGVEVSRG